MARPIDKLLDEPMVRKPIMMPPSLVGHVDKLARKFSKKEDRLVSFAEIVRRAVSSYKPGSLERDEDEVIEAILDGIISSTSETVSEIRKLNRKLDKSHRVRCGHN